MKKLFVGAFTASLLSLATITVSAQTDPLTQAEAASPTNTGTFFNSAINYFSSNDTNLSWKGVKLEMETAAEYQNGLQAANDLSIGYNINDNWQINTVLQNAGIAGTVEAAEGGVGYTLINSYAIKVEGLLDLGYSREYNSGFGDPTIELKKKLTPNTYAFIGIKERVYFKQKANIPDPWTPSALAGVGFTY